MVSLREVTRDNWIDVIRLKVGEAQQNFVASNAVSLAQAYVQPECVPLAIYNSDPDGDTPVGFCMYAMDSDDREYWIYRLMIDARYQSKGFGRAAMAMLIERIREDKARHKVYLSFEPENEQAKALYESLGFVPDGRVVQGEIVYRLDY